LDLLGRVSPVEALVLLSLSSGALTVTARGSSRLVHAAEWYMFLHGRSEAWVTESIDHGVVAGTGFGQKSRERGHQWCDG